jgi:hypothetical protein
MRFGKQRGGETPITWEDAKQLIDAGRVDEGIEALRSAVDAADAPPPAAVLLLGRTLLQQGDVEPAERCFERFVEMDPDRFDGWIGLAECAESAGRWDEAIERWRRLRADHGDARGPAWRRRVQANLFRAGRLDELRAEIDDEFDGSEGARRFRAVTSNSRDAAARTFRFQHVLIVTYGRSGSTLLQGVLNSIDGMLIRGENGNVFTKFFETFEHVTKMRNTYPHAFTPNRAWFGISSVSDATVLAGLRAAARSILTGDLDDTSGVSCLGFKEIRYDELGDRLADYLDFLQLLFPGSALVFNTRDIEATSRSGWWRQADGSEVAQRLADTTRRFEEYAAGRSNCFAIRYEDVTTKGARLRELFEFLGADYDDERVDAVLAFPHSFGPSQPDVKALFDAR